MPELVRVIPLMLAVRRQNAEVVNILLDAGTNAQLRNRRKEIAFDYAEGKPEWIDHLSTYKRLKAASGNDPRTPLRD